MNAPHAPLTPARNDAGHPIGPCERSAGEDWADTRARVETYFDRTATRAWEDLTSDVAVSRIRATVRAGRDRMRALILSRLPTDLRGARVLDAGCGAGQMTAELATRGAEVVAVDVSPRLLEVAARRLPEAHAARVRFQAGDMLDSRLGLFDFAVAMDSLIYYGEDDLVRAVDHLRPRVSGETVLTVAPRTPMLMAMWQAGRLFPRADRSPSMVPHAPKRLARRISGLTSIGRVSEGFYISHACEVAP